MDWQRVICSVAKPRTVFDQRHRPATRDPRLLRRSCVKQGGQAEHDVVSLHSMLDMAMSFDREGPEVPFTAGGDQRGEDVYE